MIWIAGSIAYLVSAVTAWRMFFVWLVERELKAVPGDRNHELWEGYGDSKEIDRSEIHFRAAPSGLLWPVALPGLLVFFGVRRLVRFVARPTPTERREIEAKEAERAAREAAAQAREYGLPDVEPLPPPVVEHWK